MMKLSAEKLTLMDSCERKFAFLQKYEPKLVSSMGMLYAALEAGLLDPDPEQAAKDECMRIAASKELILSDLNKFMSIRHVGYLAGIIAVALRDRLGPLRRCDIASNWESGLFETESGIRHRIELVSHFDDDRLRAAAHSWRVIGELAALQTPLTLTAVVIGPHRGGRRHSEWAKGLLHPTNKVLRFVRRNQKNVGFNDSWEKIWREHRTEITTEKWLEAMKQDGCLDSLIIRREIPYKEDNRMDQARRDMEFFAVAMEGSYERAPMRRSSCDDWGGCPFAHVCWNPTEASPADFPALYSIRAADRQHEEPASGTSEVDTVALPRPVRAVRARQGRHPS
jgi:hypothetical protein